MSKTIAVSDETHRRLLKRGTSGDTLDDVISHLLDITEVKARK